MENSEILSAILASASVDPITSPERGKSRNKNAGHIFERWCRDWWRKLGFIHLNTSRAESRSRDNDQIDLTNKDEHINGRFPYNVQAKCYSSPPDFATIFEGGYKYVRLKKNINGFKKGDVIKKNIKPMPTIPSIINLVFFKSTRKDDVTGTFYEQGTYVTMKLEDFEQIVKDRLELEQLRKKPSDDKPY